MPRWFARWRWSSRLLRPRHPARFVVLAAVAILLGARLLMLPTAGAGPGSAPPPRGPLHLHAAGADDILVVAGETAAKRFGRMT